MECYESLVDHTMKKGITSQSKWHEDIRYRYVDNIGLICRLKDVKISHCDRDDDNGAMYMQMMIDEDEDEDEQGFLSER